MKNIAIDEMLEMSKELFEANKDSWSPMTPEHGKTFILFMIEEIGETIAILKKKGEEAIMKDPAVRARFIEEMNDVMMYYCDVLNRFQISPEEYSASYHKKHAHNLGRDYEKDHEKSY